MTTRVAALWMAAVMAFTPAAFGSGKKEDKSSVTFHIETEASDNPKMIFPQNIGGKRRFFRRMPEISMKEVLSFTPFPTDGSETGYGVMFKLKGNGLNRLAAITNVNQGKWMISQINGRVAGEFLIDKQINDGMIVIWKGVTLEDIAMFDKQLPRIGQEGKKKKKKEEE